MRVFALVVSADRIATSQQLRISLPPAPYRPAVSEPSVKKLEHEYSRLTRLAENFALSPKRIEIPLYYVFFSIDYPKSRNLNYGT